MAENLSSLSDDEVKQLVRLIECLESSAFDFLQLEVGNMKVVLGKGNPSELAVAGAGTVQAPAVAPPATAAAAAPAPELAADEIEVCSPMMGIYYAQPEPGARRPAVRGGRLGGEP